MASVAAAAASVVAVPRRSAGSSHPAATARSSTQLAVGGRPSRGLAPTPPSFVPRARLLNSRGTPFGGGSRGAASAARARLIRSATGGRSANGAAPASASSDSAAAYSSRARQSPSSSSPLRHSPYTLPRPTGTAPAAAPRRGRAAGAAAAASADSAPASSACSAPAVESFDFLVLGSGIAGLSYALKVAQYGQVAVITKADASEGCTTYAQGGICAVLDAADSVEAHVHDTMVAGAWLNDRNAVDVVCREGPRYVLELAKFGAEFTRGAGGSLHLTREGGHSARRIVHAADATGAEIERALVSAATSHPNIRFFEHHLAVDLLIDEVGGMRYCVGADVLDQQEMSMTRFVAPVTMLATGGAGQVYPNTTNPAVTTGDGIAMAYRAKAAVANMEFVQFHPTSLFAPATPAVAAGNAAAARLAGGRSFLITEAVRGEGGMLYNLGGERFMPLYDERMELAPRDIVARSIQAEMRGRGESHVLLDISHKPAAEVLAHFPNVAAHCASLGVDITKDPIPVVPAQHYLCGGVQTGLLGETRVLGLYACGEVACSGLHGANRLASNSLLEGLVFANRAVGPSVAHAEHAQRCAGGALRAAAASADFSGPRAPRPLSPSAAAWVASKRAQLTNLMWSAAGIVRRQADMKAALADIAQLYVETRALVQTYGVNTELVELRNLVTVGELIMSSALQRRESRGGHYCEDFPQAVPHECRATVISTPAKSRLRLDLSKAPAPAAVAAASSVASASKLFSGGSAAAAPASPKRGAGAGRDLLTTTRSMADEE